ncbi:MAG: hypothetical protein ACN6OP_25910 [Pseudomonadales bacterium]
MFEATFEIIEVAKQELGVIGHPLRLIAHRFQHTKTDLVWLAADVYRNIETPQMQGICHWDLLENGQWHNDVELDELLSPLILRAL